MCQDLHVLNLKAEWSHTGGRAIQLKDSKCWCWQGSKCLPAYLPACHHLVCTEFVLILQKKTVFVDLFHPAEDSELMAVLPKTWETVKAGLHGSLALNVIYSAPTEVWLKFTQDVMFAFNEPRFNGLKRIRDRAAVGLQILMVITYLIITSLVVYCNWLKSCREVAKIAK